MLKKIGIGIAAVVVLFLVYAAFQSDVCEIERSTTIKAPPEKIFAHINNLNEFNKWNPYSKQDPNIKITLSGPAEGVGAKSAWVGNSQVGEGSMTIVESEPNRYIKIQLDFIKPFAGQSFADFTLVPQGDETAVSWHLKGPMNYIAKALNVVIDMKGMMAKQFDEGLASLKAISEAQ